MASELLKNKALIKKLKEPDIPVINFDLANSALDYNIESIEEDILPKEKPQELFEERDRLRIESLEQSLQKSKPFLMDESVDFIEREEFDKGGRPSLADQEKFYEDILKAYNKLKKELGRNPTQAELLRATGRTSQAALRTARDKFGLEFFNKPGEYNVPREVLQKVRKKQAKEAQAKKIITQPTTFQQEGVLKKVRFPNKKMEDAFKANVKLYYSFPQGSSEAKKAGATLDSFKNFYPDGVSDDVLRRHVYFYKDKLNLKFPKQEYEGQLKTQKIVNKRRENLIKEVSGFLQERQIGKAKRETGFGRAGENLDLAHRASLKQFKDFGLPYLTDNLGLDTRIVNQEILPPLETEINSLHRERMKLIKGVKPGNVPKEISKKLEDINIKLSNISMKTNGALQVVLLDEKTLKPFVFNKNYANVISQGLIDKPVKDLSKADIEFISKTFPGSAKVAKAMKIPTAEDSKNTAKKLTALQELASGKNLGFDPLLLTKAGYEEFIRPGAKLATKGALGAADFALSAGKGATGLGLGLLLEGSPIITGMSEGKGFGQTFRDTLVGTVVDAIPGVNLGSLNEDLIKLAETDDQKIQIQNLIDYQKDADRFNRRFNNYKYLEDNPFEASGIDLVAMEKNLLSDFLDLQSRRPEVYNKNTLDTVKFLAEKEAIRRQDNLLTGISGKIFGERMAKDPNFVEDTADRITRTSLGEIGAEDSFTDNYRFYEPPEPTLEQLDEIYASGIMGAAEGGRIGFADGPKDPKRRLFMKIMGGIASLPIFTKFLGKSEVAKPVVKVAGTSTKMPDWFPQMIDKAMFGGMGKKIDADLTIYEPKELPGITIGRYDDGRVFVEGQNEYGKKYMIEYEPPGYELIDEKTGKAVKKKGEFIAQEEVPVNVDRDGNADFDIEVLDDLDQILGPDTRAMEEFATGKKVKNMKSGEFAVGKAEADMDAARDFDDFYED